LPGLQTEWAAQQEHQRAGFAAPGVEPPGELLAAPLGPGAVERHHGGALRQRRREAATLFGQAQRRGSGGGGAHFALGDGPVVPQALQIVVARLPVIRSQLADREDEQLQAYIPRKRWTSATRSMDTM